MATNIFMRNANFLCKHIMIGELHMVNSVNTNSAMLWHSVNGSANSLQANSSASQANANAPVQIQGEALVSSAVRVPGGGMMSASVFKSENFSAQNPVMLVKGTDVGGKPFEVEININNVDPNNASFAEMFALDGYFALNGKPSSTTRAAARDMAIQDALAGTTNNAFTKFDFAAHLMNHFETQRFHNNWESVAWLNPVVDNLMNHIAQR
jgi:hypothetical protein